MTSRASRAPRREANFSCYVGAMPEETPPVESEKKKPGKKGKPRAAVPVPATPDTGLTSWRTWAVLGAVLVGGVIAWKLLGTSYRHDIETICNAEKGSGLGIDKDASKVTQWVRDHLGTPEGNQLYSTLGDTRLSERSKKLQDAADQNGVSPCPILESYQKLSAQGDARADVQHLCSEVSFPKLATSDDAGRLDFLEKWIDTSARSPRTKDIGAALQQAATGADRAKVLTDAASKLDVFTCTNAKTLASPPAPPLTGAPLVHLFSDPQVVGGAKEDDVRKAIADLTPDLVACYQDGIARVPDLAGKLMVKMELDAKGRVERVAPAEGAALKDPQTIGCIVAKVKTMKVAVTGPLTTVMLPFELTHASAPSP
jgi:hypothetical protein